MKASIDKIGLNHPFFDYLSENDKNQITAALGTTSHIVGIEKDGITIFAAVIDVLHDRVHVREVGGNFVRDIEWLEKYCRRVAEHFKLDIISFCTKRVGVATIGRRLGFVPSQYIDEFEKRITA